MRSSSSTSVDVANRGARRLVGQNDLRAPRQRPGDGGALLLAPTMFGVLAKEAAQAQRLDDPLEPGPSGRRRPSLREQEDVLP